MSKILSSKYFLIFFFVANIYLILSSLPLFISIKRTPKNTVFPLIHERHAADYNASLSIITLGQNGFNSFRNPYTTEKSIPSILHLLYIFLGKISAPFSILPYFVYHIARFITIELFFVAIYLLANTVLDNMWGFWAAVFALSASISPVVLFGQKEAFQTYIPWWDNLDALGRIDSNLHHLFGQTMLLLSLTYLFYYIKTLKIKYFLLSLSSAIIAGLVYTPTLLPIILAIPISIIYFYIRQMISNNKINNIDRILSKIGILIICSIVIILIGMYQLRQGYHKSVWVDWEIAKWNQNEPQFNLDLFKSFSLAFVFILPALIPVFNKNNWQLVFIFIWFMLPFLLLPLVNILSISKIRLLGMVPFIPFGIMFSLSLKQLREKFPRSKIWLIFLSIFLFSSISVTVYLLRINIKRTLSQPLYSNNYLPQENWQAIVYVKKNISKDSIILSNEFVGNILPAFSPVISYFGHINLTVDFMKKQNNIWRFYTQRMTEKEAYSFIKENKIDYVYFGTDEKALGLNNLSYTFLKPLYQTVNITIYKNI